MARGSSIVNQSQAAQRHKQERRNQKLHADMNLDESLGALLVDVDGVLIPERMDAFEFFNDTAAEAILNLIQTQNLQPIWCTGKIDYTKGKTHEQSEWFQNAASLLGSSKWPVLPLGRYDAHVWWKTTDVVEWFESLGAKPSHLVIVDDDCFAKDGIAMAKRLEVPVKVITPNRSVGLDWSDI